MLRVWIIRNIILHIFFNLLQRKFFLLKKNCVHLKALNDPKNKKDKKIVFFTRGKEKMIQRLLKYAEAPLKQNKMNPIQIPILTIKLSNYKELHILDLVKYLELCPLTINSERSINNPIWPFCFNQCGHLEHFFFLCK